MPQQLADLPPLVPVPLGLDPIGHVQWLPVDELDGNRWNPNTVHKPELRLLEHSLLKNGWIQPILVSPARIVIDGFHRWSLSKDSPRVRERWSGRVPCAVLDVDEPNAMLLTIRINRAKGTHVAVGMSRIVRELLDEHGYEPQQIAIEIGATLDEVHLLAQDGVFAVKDIAKWSYSPAWYPAEDGKRRAA